MRSTSPSSRNARRSRFERWLPPTVGGKGETEVTNRMRSGPAMMLADADRRLLQEEPGARGAQQPAAKSADRHRRNPEPDRFALVGIASGLGVDFLEVI